MAGMSICHSKTAQAPEMCAQYEQARLHTHDMFKDAFSVSLVQFILHTPFFFIQNVYSATLISAKV